VCGICGWINTNEVNLQSLIRMNRIASHRGPDGEGYWLYDGSNPVGEWLGKSEVLTNPLRRGMIGLGHRRLSIIDLSDAGLQPMPSVSRRQWIVFNGEIYNYIELRNELIHAGHHFHTETDTEVILAAYNQWGTNCFNRFNGMWGMAIVDLDKRSLILSRDRLGIKPLYYWYKANSFAFASEIKQFLSLPGFLPSANLNVIAEYIETGYELHPETFFKLVKAFPPACFGEVPLDQISEPQTKKFWDGQKLLPISQSELEKKEQLRFLFEDSVRLRMRSDVPVGVCLSGGLDSSLVYGQIQKLTPDRNSTHAFSSSFKEKQFDESPFVKLVISKEGGNVHYTFPSASSFIEDFSSFFYHHDEPPGGPSQYAAWEVMRLSRENNVPVLLNGQGGDELFSGYWPAYYLYLRYHMFNNPGVVVSNILGSILPGGNPELIKEIPAHFRQYLVRKNRTNSAIISKDFLLGRSPNSKLNWAKNAQNLPPEVYRWNEISRIHLPRLLKWDDRNSMAFSIEGRYPFLDYRLIEFAMQLPVEMNLHSGWNKYLLRNTLGNLLPPEIQWRRSKVGFVTPQSSWLNTSLKSTFLDWAENPSKSLGLIVDARELKLFTKGLLFSNKIHPMDERQHLLFRLFSLDKWLDVFGVII